MVLDTKLNKMQRTAGELRRMMKQYDRLQAKKEMIQQWQAAQEEEEEG